MYFNDNSIYINIIVSVIYFWPPFLVFRPLCGGIIGGVRDTEKTSDIQRE